MRELNPERAQQLFESTFHFLWLILRALKRTVCPPSPASKGRRGEVQQIPRRSVSGGNESLDQSDLESYVQWPEDPEP